MSRTVNLKLVTEIESTDPMEIAYSQEETILRIIRNAKAAVMSNGQKFPARVTYFGKLGSDVVRISYNTAIVKNAILQEAAKINGVSVV